MRISRVPPLPGPWLPRDGGILLTQPQEAVVSSGRNKETSFDGTTGRQDPETVLGLKRGNHISGVEQPVTLLGQVCHRLKRGGRFGNRIRKNQNFESKNKCTFL